MLKICFTGRRPNSLCGYIKDNYVPFVKQLVNILKKYITDDVQFITGGAQGFDQLSFWAADELLHTNDTQFTIENIVYVPFKGQERNWRRDGLFGQNEYNSMLNHATSVVYLENELYEKYTIIRALYDRNHSMVNDSDIVIALYPDDSWTTEKGGTAECMRYAKSKNKKIIQLKYNIVDNKLNINDNNIIIIE